MRVKHNQHGLQHPQPVLACFEQVNLAYWADPFSSRFPQFDV